MREKNNYPTENVHLNDFLRRVCAEQFMPVLVEYDGVTTIFETYEFEIEDREEEIIEWITGINNHKGLSCVSEFLISSCLQMVLEKPYTARLTPLSMDETVQKNFGGDIILLDDNVPVCLIDVTLNRLPENKRNYIGVGQLPRVVLPIRETRITIPNDRTYQMYDFLNNVIRPSIKSGYINSESNFFPRDYLEAVYHGIELELRKAIYALISDLGRRKQHRKIFQKALIARNILAKP